jgi:hypothetical protein
VAAPGYKELRNGDAGTLWLEPATPTAGIRAWLETVKLAPAGAPADKMSAVEDTGLLLTDGRADPALAPAGSPVRLSVKLTLPTGPPVAVRVFAREGRKGTVVELTPQEGAPGVFAGGLPLDAGLRPGDTAVTLVALRTEPIEVKLNGDKPDPLLEFARGLDDLEANQTYEFDPRIMASRNRLDLPITILDPRKATPSAPALDRSGPR